MNLTESATNRNEDGISRHASGVGFWAKKFARACGALFRQDHTAHRYRSRWWFLLPIFGNLPGGVIAYCAIRHDDPDKAKNCLLLGLLLFAPWAALAATGAVIGAVD